MLLSILYSTEESIAFGSNLQDILDESERSVVNEALKLQDKSLLGPLIESRENKNPFFDENTQETLLHHLAKKSDNVELFETIAEKLEEIFIPNQDMETPLDLAARKGHANIVKYMIYKGMFEMNVVYYYKYKEKEEFMGSTHMKNALVIAGQYDQKEVWAQLIAFLSGINKSHKKEDAVLDFINKMKYKYHPSIQDLVDHVPEMLKRGSSEAYDESLDESSIGKLAKPIDTFMEELLDLYGDSESIAKKDFVPMTMQLLDDMAEIFENHKSPEIKELRQLFIKLSKLIEVYEEKFNDIVQTAYKSENENNEIIKNQHKILNFISSRMEKGVNSGKDILDFAFDLWKVAFPTSEIQTLTSLFITTETYDMNLIVSTVDQFFNSSSNDFLQFAQDALKSNSNDGSKTEL